MITRNYSAVLVRKKSDPKLPFWLGGEDFAGIYRTKRGEINFAGGRRVAAGR
jgi:hypothetical protein